MKENPQVHLAQACPSARADQGAVEASAGVRAPVAWYDPTNKNPGQSVTFDKATRDKWPHLYPVALYTDGDQSCPLKVDRG